MLFDTIGWKTLNENGSSIAESKIHRVDGNFSSHTLCGIAVPDKNSNKDVSGCAGYGVCKRCERAAKNKV